MRAGTSARNGSSITIRTGRESKLVRKGFEFRAKAISEEKGMSFSFPFSPLVNSTPVRLAALGAVCAWAWRPETGLATTKIGSMVHLSSFSIWMGSIVWTTFIAGLTMFKNLPRQTFGRLQSKLFPKYFGLSAAMLVLMISTLVGASSPAWPRPANTLLLSLICTMLNIVWLEPKATKIMYAKYEVEDDASLDPALKQEKVASLGKTFGKWHGLSSLSNLIALCGAVAHAWYLASRIRLV